MAVLILALILGFGVALERSQRTSIDQGPAPDFAVTTDSGAPFRLSEQRGKVVFMNFWASWCGPCRAEAPLLNDLYQTYRDRGVQFIGIGYLDNAKDAAQFMADMQMRYPSAPDDGTRVSRAYLVKQVPESYIIDPQGQIVYHAPGVITADTIGQVRAILDRLAPAGAATPAATQGRP
jgi:cytochrome c biogenesis protein CcmG/thiol:disulfide interchange protein DsbE